MAATRLTRIAGSLEQGPGLDGVELHAEATGVQASELEAAARVTALAAAREQLRRTRAAARRGAAPIQMPQPELRATRGEASSTGALAVVARSRVCRL